MCNQTWLKKADKIQKHLSQCYCFLIKTHEDIDTLKFTQIYISVVAVACFVLCFCCCHLNFPSKWSFPDFQSCVIVSGFSFNVKTQRTHPLFACMSLFSGSWHPFTTFSQGPQEWHSSSTLPQRFSFCHSLL